MRRWILLSALLHVAAAVLGFRQMPGTRLVHRTVYQVELVTLPARAEAAPETPKTAAEIPETEKPKPISLKPPQKTVTRPVKTAPALPKAEPDTLGRSEGEPRIRVVGEPFPYFYYLEALRRRIQENWHPPIVRTETGKTSAVVRFTVRRDGRIENITLEKAAGLFLFDQSAQRAVFNAGRLPPLPSEFGGDHLNIHVEFEAL
ncbi:MAG TPA: TonB family protein [bacterium]|nr:TonB family protein [bacterium]